MNEIKTRRSPGTKILWLPGIKEKKNLIFLKKCFGLINRGKQNFRS